MAKSFRAGLPLLSAGQAQKEITHNEAVVLLDALAHACCPSAPSNAPPEAPELGCCYLCGPEPSGDWAGNASGVACWTEGGWRLVPPFDGLQLLDRSTGATWQYLDGRWSLGVLMVREVQVDGTRVVGSQQPAINSPVDGSSIDVEARSALSQILVAMRAHGLIATS